MKRKGLARNQEPFVAFRKLLLTLCFFFVLGIIAGWTAHLAVDPSDNAVLQDYIVEYAQYAAAQGDLTAPIISVLGVYFRYPIAMIVAGFTAAALFIIPLLVAAQAFFAAFSIACFASALGRKGLLLALSAFAVRYLVLLPVTLLLGVFIMEGSLARMSSRTSAKESKKTPAATRNGFRLIICAAALLVGVAIELLLVPRLLELALTSIL